MAKKARAAAKRQKRLGREEHGVIEGDGSDVLQSTNGESEATPSKGPVLSNAEIMAEVEELHRRYDDGLLDLDSFDEQRSLLMAQISVD